ncbi:hypothetical protein CN335_12510 [Bacillus thuringiensis]|uniref:hypothetical protein n=1 Tax=Bacillus thuringiensis TaxID=1428 RepID=UPI000BF910B1|nr:hypothetical protein [Bacillus thuringiensis]PFF38997.1 hypothetical protein CN335_12510 [Bacillus thuringiensis]PFT16205.1 hypothetical protein COK83_11490 [Bacillus thuringiensis]HEB2439603.1 hypothetical protein [Bacillus thuringiensis]
MDWKTILPIITAPAVVAALVSALTAVITLFITKLFLEKKGLVHKLELEHNYEQKKKTREEISKHKIQLLNAAEVLNHRIWDYYNKSYKKKLLHVKGEYHNKYFITTVYRIIVFFSLIRKIEKDMTYLDTTIASREDLNFLTFLRVFPLLFCGGGSLLDNIEGYNKSNAQKDDRFYRNDFEIMAESLIGKDGEVSSLQEFSSNSFYPEVTRLCKFLDGITPDEDRMRWDVLHMFHLTLIIFLNSYGYDFQKSDSKDIRQLIEEHRKSKIINNYIKLMEKYKLGKQREVKRVIKILRVSK